MLSWPKFKTDIFELHIKLDYSFSINNLINLIHIWQSYIKQIRNRFNFWNSTNKVHVLHIQSNHVCISSINLTSILYILLYNSCLFHSKPYFNSLYFLSENVIFTINKCMLLLSSLNRCIWKYDYVIQIKICKMLIANYAMIFMNAPTIMKCVALNFLCIL